MSHSNCQESYTEFQSMNINSWDYKKTKCKELIQVISDAKNSTQVYLNEILAESNEKPQEELSLDLCKFKVKNAFMSEIKKKYKKFAENPNLLPECDFREDTPKEIIPELSDFLKQEGYYN